MADLKELIANVRSKPNDEGARIRVVLKLQKQGLPERRRDLPLHIATLLDDHSRWLKAMQEEQDLLIQVVATELGAEYSRTITQSFSCGDLSYRIAGFRHRRSALELHLLPGGAMPTDAGIRIAPFLIGRSPVDQAAWDKIGGEDERARRGRDLPIVGVSWNDAMDWVDRAGGGLRLPREQEWEFACRAGTETRFYWGDEHDPRHCWSRRNAGGRAHSVVEHRAKGFWNAFGLSDMSGNVSEWCRDDWRSSKELRVARGGGWRDKPSHVASELSNGFPPSTRAPGIGLRVVRYL